MVQVLYSNFTGAFVPPSGKNRLLLKSEVKIRHILVRLKKCIYYL